MIIAVEKGLESVKGALRAQGHQVIDLDEPGASFHAAVFVSRSISDIPTAQNSASDIVSGAGIFLVNARGRTPEEICAIINQKAYGKLF